MEHKLDNSQEDIHEQLIQAYVECLKTGYVRLRKRLRPDYKGIGNHADHRFREVAEVLMKQHLDPYAFVKFVFNYITKKHPDVYVEQVTSLGLAHEFCKQRTEMEEEIKRTVVLNADKLKARLDAGYTLERALTDPFNEFSPAFCFAMAWSEKHYELAEKFRDQAKMAILFEPTYATALSEWLPEDMKS